MRKWNISQSFLRDCIYEDEQMLLNSNLSETEEYEIKQDIENLRKFLMGNFDTEEEIKEIDKNFEQLKNMALNKMRKIYNSLGERLINFIIMVNTFWPFPSDLSLEKTDLSLEEQIHLTFKNYVNNSPFLLPIARSMISQKPISQIQKAKLVFSSSYTYCFKQNRVPLLIVDPSEESWIFNHELEHSIEYYLGCASTTFDELGPITMEMLYLDFLYQEQGFLYEGDYGSRINVIDEYISLLASFCCVIRKFAQNNFKVSLAYFIGILREYFQIEEDEVKDFVSDHILGDTFNDYICYTLSFLKAIELKSQINESKIDAFRVIKPFIRQRRKNFDIPSNPLGIYEKYYEDRVRKTK